MAAVTPEFVLKLHHSLFQIADLSNEQLEFRWIDIHTDGWLLLIH